LIEFETGRLIIAFMESRKSFDAIASEKKPSEEG
jgi:hypothetical protein